MRTPVVGTLFQPAAVFTTIFQQQTHWLWLEFKTSMVNILNKSKI